MFPDISIADVEPLIDWNFFFPAWGLKGRVPEIFENPEHGAEARKLYDDAQKMLARIREEKLLTLQGVAGIFAAVSRVLGGWNSVMYCITRVPRGMLTAARRARARWSVSFENSTAMSSSVPHTGQERSTLKADLPP